MKYTKWGLIKQKEDERAMVALVLDMSKWNGERLCAVTVTLWKYTLIAGKVPKSFLEGENRFE